MSYKTTATPCPASDSGHRHFTIEDDGDAFQVALYQGGKQVGGGYFPDLPGVDAFAIALEIGRAFSDSSV